MLHPADYALFVLMLAGTLSIGIYYAIVSRRKKTTTEDYLTGGRQLNVVAVSISLMVSFVSPITVIGVPAEVYTRGGQAWMGLLGDILGTVLAVIIFVPVYYPLRLTSVNQYLYRRFNSKFVVILGTISNCFKMIFYTGVVSAAAATALETMSTFPSWASILIGNVLAIIYTTIGGIKAVVWTDVFQTFVLLAGLLAIAIQAVLKVGSVSTVMEFSSKWDRLDLLNFSPDPTIRYTFWSVLGSSVGTLSVFGNTQTAVQRYSSVSSLTKARLCVFLALPWVICMVTLSCLSGLAIFTYYNINGCDPLKANLVGNPNQLVPYFVMEVLNYPGVPGLLLAAMFSASLSTASSALNATAANIWDDILREIWPNLSETRNLLITKVLVVISGILAMVVSYLVNDVGGTLPQVIGTFLSSVGGPFMGMYILGLAFPFGNWIGASSGALIAFALSLWMGFGGYSINRHTNYLPTTVSNCSNVDTPFLGYENTSISLPTTYSSLSVSTPQMELVDENNPLYGFYSVSYLWIALFGVVLSLIFGAVISLLTGCNRGESVDPLCIHPWVRRCTKNQLDDQQTIGSSSKRTIHSMDNPAYLKDNDRVDDITSRVETYM